MPWYLDTCIQAASSARYPVPRRQTAQTENPGEPEGTFGSADEWQRQQTVNTYEAHASKGAPW